MRSGWRSEPYESGRREFAEAGPVDCGLPGDGLHGTPRTAPGNGSLLPQTEGTTLEGNKMVIAESVRGRTAILVITFSRKAEKEATAWTKRLTAEPATDPALALHQVAHLQDVPRVLRGLVTSMIKRGTPRQLHSTLVVLFKDQNFWKQFVNFQHADPPYVVLLGATGEAVWRTQGTFEEEKYAPLRDAIKGLASGKATGLKHGSS